MDTDILACPRSASSTQLSACCAEHWLPSPMPLALRPTWKARPSERSRPGSGCDLSCVPGAFAGVRRRSTQHTGHNWAMGFDLPGLLEERSGQGYELHG